MKKRGLAVTLALVLLLCTTCVWAEAVGAKKTSIKYQVKAVGRYENWDGVSNVSQFLDAKGNYCFAYDDGKNVVVVKTKKGVPQKGTIKLKKKHSLFGAVTCDSDGNFYVVTGEANDTDDTDKETIFISKYDSKGKHIKTVGDNGSSSLAYYYGSGFYTKIPFDGGTCDVAVNGDILAVNYARKMYSGHQSNSVFAVNVTDMSKVSLGTMYNSHSFAQRVIPFRDGFVLASEGDCYERAFTVNYAGQGVKLTEGDIFHFWVAKGTLDAWDMRTLNNNFAHMGGLAAAGGDKVCFVGTSAKSLSKKAAAENEQVFIQIFDPTADMGSSNAYVTEGKRSGLSGPNGDVKVTDYGVQWLTSGTKKSFRNPQVVSDQDGHIIVLFEQYGTTYDGVYYIVLDGKGNVITPKTRYSKTATLNPCEMPVCSKGIIYWTSNKYSDYKNSCPLYIYSLIVDKADE